MTTHYVLDPLAGARPLSASASGQTTRYLYGNDRIAEYDLETQYFLGDALGSVRQLTDANETRVSEQRSDGTVVFFVGEYYEYSLQGTEVHEKKYYGREAMRVDGVLYFILTDHLGSTSILTDGNGVKLSEQRYDAWGAVRYSSGNFPSEKLYTGQRLSSDLGLYDYKTRWYDPLVGRFIMEDPIIPQQGVMRLDRYAYVMNNPMFFTDPEGLDICDEDGNCYDRGKPSKGVKILDPVQYVSLKEEEIRILIVLIAMESSSGNVPDYINYQKAWTLLNLRAYTRFNGQKRESALAYWRMHESALLDSPTINIKGTIAEQEKKLLSFYESYLSGGKPGISKSDFLAFETQVKNAVLLSYY